MVGIAKITGCAGVENILVKIKKDKINATLVDAEAIYSLKQIESALELAKKSIGEKTAIGNSVEMEFLLWLACQTHVKSALERVGAKEKKDAVLVLFEGEAEDAIKYAKKMGFKNAVAVKKNEKALEFLGMGKVGKKESDEIEKMIIEKMALSRIQN